MAAPWANQFYCSPPWRNLRDWYITTVNGLCEVCGEPGLILHHKIRLTQQNINNPDISLNPDLLEFLCQDCHNKVYAPKMNRRYKICDDGTIAPPDPPHSINQKLQT